MSFYFFPVQTYFGYYLFTFFVFYIHKKYVHMHELNVTFCGCCINFSGPHNSIYERKIRLWCSSMYSLEVKEKAMPIVTLKLDWSKINMSRLILITYKPILTWYKIIELNTFFDNSSKNMEIRRNTRVPRLGISVNKYNFNCFVYQFYTTGLLLWKPLVFYFKGGKDRDHWRETVYSGLEILSLGHRES